MPTKKKLNNFEINFFFSLVNEIFVIQKTKKEKKKKRIFIKSKIKTKSSPRKT
jgi:hypothetical protein